MGIGLIDNYCSLDIVDCFVALSVMWLVK
jgi:hypothetical protein